MPILRSALTALMIGAATPAFVASAFAQTCACPQTEGFAPGPVIQADEAPPPLPVYEQPPIPAPNYVWTPGYWAWNNYDYYWVPGVWVEPAQTGLLWTPGYWAFVGGAYLFHQGYWGQHVGFYGGVNYGYGYNGLGYQGGRWEGSRFVYNTTVNNFGGVRVANVYTENVTAAPGAARVSYNGGPGGIALKPTPEQERLTTEARVKPTPLQVTQARTASMEGTQFRSANQGKPAVAATERPGELKGPGAVPAKAAGSAELHEGQAPNGEEKLPPRAKPPAGAPNAEGKLPTGATLTPATPLPEPRNSNLGEKPAAPAQTPAGEKPVKPEPRSSNIGEKPAQPAQTPAGEKSMRPEPQPAKAELRPPQEKAPGGPPRPEGMEKSPRPEPTPNREMKAPESPRPTATAMPPGAERPRPEIGPGGGPKGPPAALGRPQRPEGGERDCGKPGAPPCR